MRMIIYIHIYVYIHIFIYIPHRFENHDANATCNWNFTGGQIIGKIVNHSKPDQFGAELPATGCGSGLRIKERPSSMWLAVNEISSSPPNKRPPISSGSVQDSGLLSCKGSP